MKKYQFKIILLCLIIVSISSGAQEYVHFPSENVIWTATHCEPGPFMPNSGMVKVVIRGDTLINEKTYKQLWLNRENIFGSLHCDTCDFEFTEEGLHYFTSFREEDRKIYIVPVTNGFGDPDGTEYCIFNFNVSEVGEKVKAYQYVFIPFGSSGDPLHIPTPGCGTLQDTITLTVESIDQVRLSDGSYRRRINFVPLTYGGRESWIEGIGSTKGFGLSNNYTNHYNSMVCFSHDGLLLNTDDIRSDQLCVSNPDVYSNMLYLCENTSSVPMDSISGDKTSIFPNPCKGIIRIKTTLPGSRLAIFSILGEEIKIFNLEKESAVLDISDLGRGMYFYRLSADGRHIGSGRLIKE